MTRSWSRSGTSGWVAIQGEFDITRFDRGQRVAANGVDLDAVRIDVTRHDAVGPRIDSAHLELGPAGISL